MSLQFDDMTRHAARWLLREQDPSGGWGEREGLTPNTLNTAEVIISLLEADAIEPGATQIQKAVGFFARHQHDSGAWCREVRLEDDGIALGPDLLRTALAVQALIKAGRSTGDEPVRGAIAWLLSRQHADGGWSFSDP
jgi:squalene cyclase